MPTDEDPRALEVLAFWWDAGPEKWFAQDEAFDGQCRAFEDLVEEAVGGNLDAWRASAAGTLALIVLTDQFPRNLFRGTRRAFASDALALDVADHAVAQAFPSAWPMPARSFFLLPFMHSEDLSIQELSLDLYRATGNRDAYYYALVHHDVIRRFGRFPHRNASLGRQTTAAEQAFLDSGGFSA